MTGRASLALISLLLAACRSPAGPDGGALPAHSVAAPAGVMLKARSAPDESGRTTVVLVLANSRNRPAQVEYGACSFMVWGYATPLRRGRPAWQNAPPPGAACIDIGYSITVPALGTAQLPVGRVGPEILGDELPPGRYYLTLVLRHRGGDVRRLSAGEALLSR